MIAPVVSVGARPHRVRFDKFAQVPDGEGGWIESWVPLAPPEVFAEIRPVLAMDFESEVSAALIAIATHVVTAPWHPQVTTKTRLMFGTRQFDIASVSNRDERGIEMVLLCKEVIA